MRWRRVIGWSAAGLFGLLLAVAGTAFFWVGQSTSFLRWALGQASSLTDGALQAEEVRGSLLGGFLVSRLSWADAGTRIEVSGLGLRWRPGLLLAGELRLASLRADRIEVSLAPGDGTASEPLALPDRIALPLRVGIDALEVDRIAIIGEGLDIPVITDLAARVRIDENALVLSGASVRAEGWASLKADASLAVAQPFETRLSARIEPALPDFPDLTPLMIEAGGPLRALALRLRLLAPAGQTGLSEPGSGAPAWAIAETTVDPLGPVPLRELALSLNGLEPDVLGLPGPRSRLSGTIVLQADGEAGRELAAWRGRVALRNALPGRIDSNLVPLSTLETGFDWRDGVLSIDGLEIDEGRLTGDARVDTLQVRNMFGVEVPGIRARLALKELDAASLHGQAWPTRLGGTLTLDEQRLRLDLAETGSRPVRLAADASLQDELVRIASLTIRTPSGTIETAGSVRWAAPLQLDLSGRFSGLQPARLAALAGLELPEPAGALAGLGGSWAAKGPLEPTLALDSRLAITAGEYQGRPLRIDWRGRVAVDRVTDARLEASLGDLRAQVSGGAGRPGDRLRLSLRVPSLAAIDPALPDAAGVEAAIGVDGELAIDGFDASSLERARVSLNVDLRRLVHAAVRVDRARVSVDGTLGAHRGTLALTGGRSGELELAGELGVSGGLELSTEAGLPWRWSGRLERFAARSPLPVNLAAPMPLIVTPEQVQLGAASLRADGGRLDLERLVLRDGRFDLAGTAENLPVSRWAERFGLVPVDAARIDEVSIGARWALAGSDAEDLDGTLQLTVSTTRKLDADGRANLVFARGALSGDVDLALPSVAIANRMIGPEWAVAGRLRVRATLAGTVLAPRFDGTLEGRELAMVQRRLGWRFADGELDARFDGNRLEVSKLRLSSGEGSVALNGSLLLEGMQGEFQLLADRLPVPIGPGQRIVVSGDTRIVSDAAELKWLGKIRAEEGLIELRGGEAPALPGDVVLVDRSGPPPETRTDVGGGGAAMRLTADLEVDLGRDIRVRGSGVDARLTGSLRLAGSLPEAPRATGTVRIRDGTYSAYGQTLEISRGRVIFNGPLDNPVLDITAMRRGPAVEAGVAVTGTVLSPRIRLVSEPDVPDAQKLSWLVLGVGPDDARTGGQMVALQAAAATLFGGEGGGIVSELQRSLGLDVLTVRNAAASGFDANFGASFPGQAGTGSTPTTGANQDVIAIGKRLGSRMMVTYEQGLRGVWSLLRFQYDITRRLSVRAQTGTDTALDLLYFYSFD